MKWRVGLVLLLLCAAGVYFAVRAAPSTEVVFRGMAWGDPPAKLGSFAVKVKNTQNSVMYIRRDDSFIMDNAELKAYPVYGFVRGGLMFVVLRGDYSSLERIGYAKYGVPQRIEGEPIWKTDNLVCSLTHDKDMAMMVIAERTYAEGLAEERTKALKGIW